MPRTEKLLCAARGVLVANTPEEKIRQQLIEYLIGPFGCPKSLLAVEVSLNRIGAVHHRSPIRRRIDIVCFSVWQGGLSPLLLIECKASPPKDEALHQLNGYNFFTKAPAVAIAWSEHIVLCHRGAIMYQGTIDSMPSYEAVQNFDALSRG